MRTRDHNSCRSFQQHCLCPVKLKRLSIEHPRAKSLGSSLSWPYPWNFLCFHAKVEHFLCPVHRWNMMAPLWNGCSHVFDPTCRHFFFKCPTLSALSVSSVWCTKNGSTFRPSRSIEAVFSLLTPECFKPRACHSFPLHEQFIWGTIKTYSVRLLHVASSDLWVPYSSLSFSKVNFVKGYRFFWVPYRFPGVGACPHMNGRS